MLKHEIYLIKHNKRAWIVFGFLLFLVLSDLTKIYWMNFTAYGYVWKTDYKNLASMMHPAKGAFLSAVTEGHINQMMYKWLLPIYLLLIYCDKTIEEIRSGYFSVMMLREGKKQFLKSKYKCAFVMGFMIVFLTLFINFILSIIMLHGGKDMGMDISYFPTHPIFVFSLKYPYIAYSIYIMIVSILGGGCAMICTGLSLVVKQYRYLYVISFLIWYIQIIAPKSLTYVMQPFIEYDWQYVLPAIAIFVVIWWIVVCCGYFYRMKKDEF